MDWKNPADKELGTRALDAAIGAMARNRALLFALNLLAGLVLVTVYLERASLDDHQRKAHLVALYNICNSLDSLGVEPSVVCSADPDRIQAWALSTMQDPDKLQNALVPIISSGRVDGKRDWMYQVSRQLYRLRLVKNEMDAFRLPGGQSLPIGVDVPRNDLAPIAGMLLVLLYSWLCFSFRQLSSIVKCMRDLLAKQATAQAPPAMMRQIIEFQFLFRTSKKGPASWFVRALYYSPPAAMAIALANDLFSISVLTNEWKATLLELTSTRLLIEVGALVALMFIGYQIKLADDSVNTSAFGAKVVTDE